MFCVLKNIGKNIDLNIFLQKHCENSASLRKKYNVLHDKSLIISDFFHIWNKLASLEATLVQNSAQRLSDGGECRATSVDKDCIAYLLKISKGGLKAVQIFYENSSDL